MFEFTSEIIAWIKKKKVDSNINTNAKLEHLNYSGKDAGIWGALPYLFS